MSNTLRIAIQKSGKLREGSMRLLKESGLTFYNGVEQLKSKATNFPLEVLFLRDDDIPQYVEDRVADVGIVGQNVLMEKSRKNEIVARLGFGKCRLSIAIPRFEQYTGSTWLEGKNIATSYPRILRTFLESKKIQADIHEISGSVEIAPSVGLADAICDIVSSGSTLQVNGLTEAETIMESEAVLVSGDVVDAEKQAILDQLVFRFKAVNSASNSKYILLNCPNEVVAEIIALLPGIKSPTVMPLARQGWSSLHSVVDENDFWQRINHLKACGAEGILVMSIEKRIN